MRLAAVIGLGEIADPQSIEPLFRLTHDVDCEVRQCAVLALSKNATPRAVEMLIESLDADDQVVRIAVAKSLRARDDPRGNASLAQLITDPDPAIREHAAYCVERCPEDVSLGLLLTAIPTSQQPINRLASLLEAQPSVDR